MKNIDVLELFTDVNKEAQEAVSGGVTSVDFTAANLSRFPSWIFPALTFGLPLSQDQKNSLIKPCKIGTIKGR